MENKFDALGNLIELGKVYGMSRNSNGHTTINIGKVINFTERGVTLQPLSSMSCIYSNKPEKNKWSTAKKISVLSTALFPVYEQDMKNLL